MQLEPLRVLCDVATGEEGLDIWAQVTPWEAEGMQVPVWDRWSPEGCHLLGGDPHRAPPPPLVIGHSPPECPRGTPPCAFGSVCWFIQQVQGCMEPLLWPRLCRNKNHKVCRPPTGSVGPVRPDLEVVLNLGSSRWGVLTTDLPEQPPLRGRPGIPGVLT